MTDSIGDDSKKLLYKYLIYVKRGQPFGLPPLVSLPLARFSVRIPQGVTSPRYLRLIAEKLTDALDSLFFRDPHGTSCTGAACD